MTSLATWMAALLVVAAVAAEPSPADRKATPETRQLLARLARVAADQDRILFGQQRPNQLGAEGGHAPYALTSHGPLMGWNYTAAMAEQAYPDTLCDVCGVTGGVAPAVEGYDFQDWAPWQRPQTTLLAGRAAARGQVVALCQHHSNYGTGGLPWVANDTGDVYHSVRRILPGGDLNWKFNQNLDLVAEWAHNFTDTRGRPIPFLFRAWHELNGDWFWWGLDNRANNSVQDLVSLWRYTVHYLRDVRQVHNILYIYCTDKFQNQSDYLKTYPGDDYIDIFGLDFYYKPGDTKADYMRMVSELVTMAESRGKIPALAESGLFNNGIDNQTDFWSDSILNPLKSSPERRRLTYILSWSNECYPDHECGLWLPYKGHPAAADFFNHFYRDPMVVFADRVPDFYH